MKMIIVFVLALGILLAEASTTAQQADSGQTEISFETFCRNFDKLRKTATSSGASTMNDVINSLNDIRDQLVTNGILPDRYPLTVARERCVDPSKYFDPECVYAFYYHFTMDNSFFIRINKDNIRAIYVDILLLHPLLRRCLPYLNKDLRSNDAKSRLAIALSKADQDDQFHEVFYGRNGLFLKEEIEHSCESKPGDQTFCSSLSALVKLAYTFEEVKFASKTSVRWNAFSLHFVMLKHNNPDEFGKLDPKDASKVNDVIVKNLDEIFKYINNAQISELVDLMSLVPDLKTIKSGCETSWNLPENIKKNECMFWKAVIQVKTYLQSITPPASGKVKKILNTNIDFPTFLSLTEMDRILQVVQNQETALQELTLWLNSELTKTINERFQGLQTYFTKVETFNREIANADIGYVNGRLDKYGKNIASLSTQLGGNLDQILKHAIAAVSLEIAEDTVQVGLAAAVVMNPLESIFGGSSVGDFMDRAGKLAHSLTDVGALVDMRNSFDDLVTKTESISTRFNSNAKFLENVRVLVDSIEQGTSTADFETRKQEFLTQYTAYDPQVEKPELAAMVTTWENLIEDSCEIILGTETALAAAVVALVRSSGLCPNTKVLAQEMIATYEEVYDFQFELIEAMATYMRAATAQDAASSITADYEELSSKADNEDVINDLNILSEVSLISYKTNIWQITEAYCDILEYKEGGVRPSICQGTNTDIASLASHVSLVCRNVEANKDVPISSDSDQAFMDLSDLYSGKRVTFKIPNSQWLVDNRWINAPDKNKAIVVKKFEVFLPTVSATERMARVEAKVVGWNQFSPPDEDRKSYIIVPQKNFIFEYLEGHGAQCRKEGDALSNPYGSTLPNICPLNVDDNNCQELLQKTSLFPSVYSQWLVSISGYESVPVPDPATVMNLKVGVKLCILDRPDDDKGMKTKGKRKKIKLLRKKNKIKLRDATSCADGQYWSGESRACTKCPKGSRSALHGYYCEKKPKKN